MHIGTFFISTLDLVALIWFIVVWFSYSLFADIRKDGGHNLVTVMHHYRMQWARQMIKRSDRFIDVRIIGNLLQSTSFFASTSMILVAGAAAALGFGEKGVELVHSVGFMDSITLQMWMAKTGLLLFIFIYAFFKFTWVMRQFNYAAVLIAAAPIYHEGETPDELRRQNMYAHKTATMLSNAAKHFNLGMRSYYFGMAALAWYVNPYLLMAASVMVVAVIYRREYLSKTLLSLI